MTKSFFIPFAILLLLSASQLSAQIVTDRPDQTESSSTVGKGNLQIESGLLLGFMGEESPSTRQLLIPTTLFRYGLTKGIELRLGSQFETLKTGETSVQGISDIHLGAKFQIFQKEDSRTEIAFVSHLVVPTGSPEVSSTHYATINRLAVSHELNEKLGFAYNLGYNYAGTGSGDFTYSMVLAVGVNEKVGVYIEPYGEVVNMEDFLSNINGGFTYLLNENLQLDFSFGTGINHHMNYIAMGCSWKLLSAE